MKVICINTTPPAGCSNMRFDWFVKEGEVYTVINEHLASYYSGGKPSIPAYELAEDPGAPLEVWPKTWFIPLSEIDEMELVNEKAEAI